MRVLITGATGFVGSHLCRTLAAGGGVELFGLSLQESWPAGFTDLEAGVRLFPGDLCDEQTVDTTLREVQPDRVYHLAGYADVGRSFQEAEAAWGGNLTATLRLYDAILRWGGRPRVLYVSSGMVYGESDLSEGPVDESAPFRPESPYAASKAAADLASYQYARCHDLPIVRVRPFNHIGPAQSPRFAIAHFAHQIALIERGDQPPVLRVGNLGAERDLTDVRDVARAYTLLLERGIPGDVYNLGSGRTWSMRACLDRLLVLSRVAIAIETDPALIRKVDTAAMQVDIGVLRRATGWAPAYSIDQTLADTLNYWRRHA